MATLTRQQLINLINRYIYTNGNQRITAAQLNEILLDIADTFAIEGGGTASGIDAVLEAGSIVTADRKITNEYGGSVNLAATFTSPDVTFNYTGFEAETDDFQGATYTGLGRNVVGNLKRLDPEKTILKTMGADVLDAGEVFAGIYCQALNPPKGTSGPADGVRMNIITDNGKNELGVARDSIYSSITQNSESYSRRVQYIGQAQTDIVRGPQSSHHFQDLTQIESSVLETDNKFYSKMDVRSATWLNQNGPVFTVAQNGVKLSASKKMALTTGGSSPTAGVIGLGSGSATISTSAVLSTSIISLTVQEGGVYTGRIRVSAKVPGTSFTISSSIDTDTCSVFWQIIDL